MSLSIGGAELGWPAVLEVPKYRKRAFAGPVSRWPRANG